MIQKCVFCGDDLYDGYQLIAIDGVMMPGKTVDFEPIFHSSGQRVYKNYFVHKECEQEFREKLAERLKELD